MECPPVRSPEGRRIKAVLPTTKAIKDCHQRSSLSFCLVCVRPITEYTCQVFRNALPHYLSGDLERLQKRALRIIFPGFPTKRHLAPVICPHSRREGNLTTTLFKEAVENKSHKLNKHLPPQNKCSFNLRSKRNFSVKFKTNRFRNTFITSNTLKYC